MWKYKIATEQIKQMNVDNKFLVGVNISAGSEARFWGVENYQKLLQTLSKFNVRVILYCPPKDLHYALEITSKRTFIL